MARRRARPDWYKWLDRPFTSTETGVEAVLYSSELGLSLFFVFHIPNFLFISGIYQYISKLSSAQLRVGQYERGQTTIRAARMILGRCEGTIALSRFVAIYTTGRYLAVEGTVR